MRRVTGIAAAAALAGGLLALPARADVVEQGTSQYRYACAGWQGLTDAGTDEHIDLCVAVEHDDAGEKVYASAWASRAICAYDAVNDEYACSEYQSSYGSVDPADVAVDFDNGVASVGTVISDWSTGADCSVSLDILASGEPTTYLETPIPWFFAHGSPFGAGAYVSVGADSAYASAGLFGTGASHWNDEYQYRDAASAGGDVCGWALASGPASFASMGRQTTEHTGVTLF